MRRYRNKARVKIAEAIEKCEQYGIALTPDNIKTNAELTHRDLPAEYCIDTVTDQEVRTVMKLEGLIISDTATRVRTGYWKSGLRELREQRKIKHEGTTFDLNREKAEDMAIEFMEGKEKELGYAVYPELFEEEIDRIYRMNHCEAPGR